MVKAWPLDPIKHRCRPFGGANLARDGWQVLREALVPAIGGNSEEGDRDGNTGNAREGDGEA